MSVTVNTSNVKVVTAETDAGTAVTVKVNGAIPVPFPSPGPQGEKGDTGEKGDKGDTGEQGPQGNPTTVNGKTGATITLTKADIGLGNVPNTDATNPANITQSASYRFVSDTEKAAWNGKQNALAYTPEDVALKQNSLATPDSSHYPTTQAVSSALSAKADLVNGKVPLSQINDALIGNVHYKGLYNFGTGLITSDDTTLDGQPLPTATSGNVGWYFISADSGTLNGIDFITGDWIISNGSYGWHKVDNTDAVSSVNGYTGNVVLSKADIGLGNVPNTDATNPANTVQSSSYRYVSDTEKAVWNGKLSASDADGRYFPLTGGTLTGSAGAGYFGLPVQTVTPDAPASGLRLYSDASNRLSWINSLGFARTFRSASLTASRLYTLPDADGTFAFATGLAGGQTIAGGTAASEALTLSSTTHATKGAIIFGTSRYDENLNYLGINITPSAPFHVASNTSANMVGDTYGSGNASSQFLLRRANGTIGSPSIILANDRLGLFGGAGWKGDDWSGFTGVLTVAAEADWVQGSSYPTYLTLSTTASGATTRTERIRFSASGLVGVGTTSPAALLNLGGNQSAAFTINGNYFRINGATITDSTTSAGTNANAYASVIGAPVFATAANAITITRAGTLQINPPTAGSNVTITTAYALILSGALALPSSSSSRAPLNIPSGATPTSPVPIAGDIWANGNKLKFFYTGANRRIVDTNDATPTNGQIPIGNGTDYTVAALTAGTGIAISNATGAITISGEGLQSKAGDPTITDVPTSSVRVYKNTSTGAVKLWANDGGTLKSVTLT